MTSAKTPAELRASAAEDFARAEESFQRVDTDGFLSQWALGITGREKLLQASIDENGGTSEFVGLFNEKGERIKAKLVRVYDNYKFTHVSKWIILDDDDKAIHWINRTTADVGEKPSPRSKMGQLGLHEEYETAPAKAFIDGVGRGLSGNAWAAVKRTDGGYPEGAVTYRKETE